MAGDPLWRFASKIEENPYEKPFESNGWSACPPIVPSPLFKPWAYFSIWRYLGYGVTPVTPIGKLNALKKDRKSLKKQLCRHGGKVAPARRILIGWIHWFCIRFSFYCSIGPMEHRNKPKPPMLSSLGEGFNNEGKGYERIIIAFFCYSSSIWDKPEGCRDETNRCTAESRIRFCFVETSSTSLRNHEEFQGNFNDGWTKVVFVWAYFDATPLLHPFTTCPPQEDGSTIGEQKNKQVQTPDPLHRTGATDVIVTYTMSEELDKGSWM